MRNFLLFTDPHFTDNEIESYRWNIFKTLKEVALKNKVTNIICLGDLVDRKDRHSAKLVNMLVEECSDLCHETHCSLDILSGNHDKPLNGPYFWKFLNNLDSVNYIREPEFKDGNWLLPFSPNPIKDWQSLDLKRANAIFIHQTLAGAIVDGDRVISSSPHPMPELPNIPVYSGDVHRPQDLGKVTYIGVPHPIRFSESWDNRVIVVRNDNFKNPENIWLDTTRRAIIDIKDSSELLTLDYGQGDQLRIRYQLKPQELTKWPAEEEAIRVWAEKNKIHIASLESTLIGDGLVVESQEEATALEIMPPEDVVKLFGEEQKLGQVTIDMGLELVKLGKV